MTWKSIFLTFLLRIGIFAVLLLISFKGIEILGERYSKYAIFYGPVWIVLVLFGFFSITVDLIAHLYHKITKKRLSFYVKITFITIIISICLYFISQSINNAYRAAEQLQTRVNELRQKIDKEEKEMYSPSKKVGQKDAQKDSEYIVKVGDNLWDISAKYYQSGFNWIYLGSYNQLRNPRLIYPNQKLRIPAIIGN